MLYQLSYFRNLICFCFLTISKNNRYRSVLRVQRYCFFLNHQIYFEKKSLFFCVFLIFAHFWPKMRLFEGKNGDFLYKKSRWASECFFLLFRYIGTKMGLFTIAACLERWKTGRKGRDIHRKSWCCRQSLG